MAARVMCHTPEIQQRNYATVAVNNAAIVGKSIMAETSDLDDGGDDTHENEVDQEQEDKNNEEVIKSRIKQYIKYE